MQPSFKLHGKAVPSLPAPTADRILEIRDVLSQYDPKNIYVTDESVLFYRLGPSRTYLTANESRRDTRRAEFQKHRRHISFAMCVNCDGSHILPVSYIGTAKNPHCFRDPRFTSLKENYWAQENGSMSSNGFRRWINFWYGEVKKISSGPWCLLIDNCGSQELDFTLNGVRIEFLPPRSAISIIHLISF